MYDKCMIAAVYLFVFFFSFGYAQDVPAPETGAVKQGNAQDEAILFDQINAVLILANRVGFTEATLNQYLTKKYGKALTALTKQEAAEMIAAFQGLNPPRPEIAVPAASGQENQRILEVGMAKRFHLKNGNIVEGKVIGIKDKICQIETIDGTLNIPIEDILDETANITKKDGTRFNGPIIKETPEEVVIRSEYGDVMISKKDIRNMERFHGGKKVPETEEKKVFLQGEASLINTFMDPTAFLLEPHTFYISGLSIGYGFTEMFMVTTKYGSGFAGDLNVHPKLRFYHRQTGTSEQAAAIGFALHRRYKYKQLVAKYSHAINDTTGNSQTAVNKIDNVNVDSIMLNDDPKGMYGEAYLVLSSRRALSSGRGKIGWSVGFQTNTLPLIKDDLLKKGYAWNTAQEFAFPFRTWASVEYDLRKSLKFIGVIWADNGNKMVTFTDVIEDYLGDQTPFLLDSPKGTYSLFDFDFGFLYAITNSFRFGLHFQQPYIDIYWEFFEF